MRPTSGLTFGGRYQLSSRVAIGGMGEVWQATDLVIGRTVAIKILKDEYLGDPGFLERFRAEARHAALVNHEGIANVFDYGEEEGSAYLVMELVPGEALSAVLERERVLSTDRVLDIVAQTANALQAAHAAGLVHRDIKPGNLLITPDGRVKITDFGIARIADQVPLTATGQVMGTVQYLSPEQASGHPASPSTDIYSLGIVAYEALAGRRPFTGESQVAIAMAHINETPPDLPVTVSEPVRNLVYACIAKSPGDRPASASHLARAAQALRRGDVREAAAAVPAVLGAAGVAGAGVGATAATRVMGAPTAVSQTVTEEEVEPEEKKRSRWLWPIIALIAILALGLIALIVALLLNPGGDADPSRTPSQTQASETPSETPSEEPSEEPEPEPETVSLTLEEIAGRNQDEVGQILFDKGLNLTPVVGIPAPSLEEAGLAYEVSQTGPSIPLGTNITVTFYDAFPAPPTPSAPVPEEAGPYDAGSTVGVSWGAYGQCPAGTSLTAYRLDATGATIIGASNPLPPSTTSVELQLPNSPQQVSVTLTAICGEIESEPSSALVLDVQ